MEKIKDSKNTFFVSIWIIFLTLVITYSIYILITSPSLALNLKPNTDQIVPYVSFKIILGLYFIIAVFNIGKILDKKIWFLAILVVGLISRVILIPSQPVLEDDYYRYLWDGAVTAHAYNPYVYSPFDAMDNANQYVPDELRKLSSDSGDIIKNINHPHIRTIYPVLSQIVFAIAYKISPWEYWAWKLLLLLFDLLLLVFLIKIVNHLKLPLVFISFYWLNPIVIHEFFNAAHMDLPAILFAVIALYFHLKGRMWHSVIFIALAAGFKLWPIVLLPLILRKVWADKNQFLRYAGVFTGIVILFFIPVIVSNLDESLGFIRYAGRWINNAAFYQIFKWLVNEILALISLSSIAVISRVGIVFIYLIILYYIVRKEPTDRLSFFHKALLTVAVLYLLSPTQFPWYYTWMVPLLVIRPKVSLLIYPLLLPLYQINYLSEYLVYVQHIPIIILLILELNGVIWKEKFELKSL